MLIPKSFIPCRAARHKENLPSNIKYGCYSRKAVSFACAHRKESLRRYQKKQAREICLKFFQEEPRGIEPIRIFSMFKNVRKLKIDLSFSCRMTKRSAKIVIKILAKLLKTLKRIKNVVIRNRLDFQKSSRFLKKFLLAMNLEPLTLLGVYYGTAHFKNLQLFLQTIKLASNRRCWFNLKSPNIEFWTSKIYFFGPTGSLQRLLRLIQRLKSCESVNNWLNYKLITPEQITFNSEQTEILNKIAQTDPPFTQIEVSPVNPLPEILKVIQHSKSLKGVSIRSTD